MIEDNTDRWDARSERLLGAEAIRRLASARVLVVGCGGVGGYAVEMLVRSGIGHITAVDADNVEITNLNRQIIATIPDLGRSKTEVLRSRALSINPGIDFNPLQMMLTPGGAAQILDVGFDFVADCIDTVAPKVALLSECMRRKLPVISSMGAGGRTDPSKIIYTDLWRTSGDGLARAVRQRLKKAGLKRKLTVVASTEIPAGTLITDAASLYKRTSPGTVAPVPSAFGIFIGAYIINYLKNDRT